MKKTFLVSVANVVGMIGNEIVFTSKTESSTSFNVQTSNTEIRGGQGNQLQGVYYHTGTFSCELVDTQFKLDYIALNTGSSILGGGGKIWTSETVVLNGNIGTLLADTPVAIDGQPVAVWVEYEGIHYTLPVTDSNTFSVEGTDIPANSTICVSYRIESESSEEVTIPANIIPARLRVYLIGQLYGDTTGEQGSVGTVEVEIPVAQLSGAQEITMNADGYSTTPLSLMAIAYNDESVAGCARNAYYAKITVVYDNMNWYDGVTALAIVYGDFDLTVGGTRTLTVYAQKGNRTFKVDNSKLTFTSSTTGVATVGEHTGLVTAVEAGTSLITVKITDKTSIEANATVTVSAAE